MKISRLKRRRCHYADTGKFYIYKLHDLRDAFRNRIHSYLSTAGILSGSRTFTGPAVVQIDITNRCNNNCILCWVRSPLLEELAATKEWENRELPFNLVVSLLDELCCMGTQRIFFAGGGEPFIHPEIIKILEHAAKKRFECHFNTNFTFINEEIIKKLVSLSAIQIHINVSLWAASAENYVRTHPNKTRDTFYRIIDMLKLFAELKIVRHVPHINIYNVISKFNFAEIYEMVKLAYDVGADSVQFVPMDPINGKTEHLLLDEHEKKEALTQLKKAKTFLDSDLKNKAGANLFICDYEQITRRFLSENAKSGEYDIDFKNAPCYVGWEFARITANGDVHFCLKANNMSIGNVNNQDFKSIWTSRIHNDLRHRAKFCKDSDTFFNEVGCHRTCDNLWINENVQNKLDSINILDLAVLRGINFLLNGRKS